jgi:uncharacterized membrane protein
MADNTNRPILDTITDQEKADGKLMAILAYIGILFLIPMFTSKDNKFVMYHVEQGIVLFIAWFAVRIVFIFLDPIFYKIVSVSIPCGGSILGSIVTLVMVILWIMGILNAVGGKVAPLPIIGQYGEKFNLVK